MTNQFSNIQKSSKAVFLAVFIAAGSIFLQTSCAVSSAQTETAEKSAVKPAVAPNSPNQNSPNIAANSPQSAVLEFYKAIREKRFQQAFLMTNWKPAVEGLTAPEIADLQPDFENLSSMLESEKLALNGEQISTNNASVFVQSTDPETGAEKKDEIKLRKENGAWVLLLGDEQAEAAVKSAGKSYFFNLRISVHQQEVEAMLERVAKAQIVSAIQNGGLYSDFETLINANLIPADIKDETILGYKFRLMLTPDRKSYRVNAEPTTYGKTGKLSYILQLNEKDKKPTIKKSDNNGQPVN